MTILIFVAIVIGVLFIVWMVKGLLRGIALFILVLAALFTATLVGIKVKPNILPVSIHNGVLEVHAGKTNFEVSLADVASVDAINTDEGVQISGAAGGQLFNAKVNKWIYKFALKPVLEKQLGDKLNDRTSRF
jgi:hypothetical protein